MSYTRLVAHVAAYSHSNDLAKRTISEKILKSKAYESLFSVNQIIVFLE